MNKFLLDQTIIVKALYILKEVFDKPNEFITKEMLERLPELQSKEMTKLTLLERELNDFEEMEREVEADEVQKVQKDC